jgi:protoporphyrinogen oxidase
VVWEPLLKGKFGRFYKDVSAVWFWNKLVLRGGTRSKKTSKEVLLYLNGGFARIVETLCAELQGKGTSLNLGTSADAVRQDGELYNVSAADGRVFKGKKVLLTTAPSLSAHLLRDVSDKAYQDRLNAITYLGNVCVVLILDRKLGDNYWTNVNDVSFPFVGIVEHTNLIDKGRYAGKHIVYLSKYLDTADALFTMSSAEVLDYCIPHIQRMFPAFDRSWITDSYVWKAEYAQPLVIKDYSKVLPPLDGPKEGIFLSSMAHIYPEDRGTNYAVKMGKEAALAMLAKG